MQALLEVSKTRKATLKRNKSVEVAAATEKSLQPAQTNVPAIDNSVENVIGILFFAGHGMEIGGENLLVSSLAPPLLRPIS